MTRWSNYHPYSWSADHYLTAEEAAEFQARPALAENYLRSVLGILAPWRRAEGIGFLARRQDLIARPARRLRAVRADGPCLAHRVARGSYLSPERACYAALLASLWQRLGY